MTPLNLSYIPFLALLVVFGCISPSERTVSSPTPIKYCGVSLEGPPKEISPAVFDSMTSMNGNAVCLMPYAYMESLSNPEMVVNPNWQWWGEGPEGIIQCIRLAHKRKMTVMVKPHIWVKSGDFTGDISMHTDDDWVAFEKKYLKYILSYARICDSFGAETLCIGTELKTFVEKRPGFWLELIDTVKTQYGGEITYAENWDSYKNVPFWSKLDYIGIDAYFPLNDSQTPKVSDLEQAWKPIKADLKTYRDQVGKNILFTEYGYRSIDHCAQFPWESHSSTEHNEMGQSNSYEAFYKTFWHEPWIKGGYLWKWFSKPSRGTDDNSFAIQGKKASFVIKRNYKPIN